MGKSHRFLRHAVWRMRTDELGWFQALGVQILRVFLLIGQGFTKSQVQLGASSLAFYSLLSAVPILTFFFGIARGFLLEKAFRQWLLERFDDQQIVVDRLTSFAQHSITQGHAGVVIGTGLLLLLWSGARILNHLELAMNAIWEVRRRRTLARRFSDYMALFFIAPIFVLVSISLTAYFSGSEVPLIKALTPVLNLIPLFLLWVLFTFIYIFLPNVRVSFFSAFWAGLVTAIIYQGVQWGYIHFQIGVSQYSAIYGTLAALPLFLAWLYVSWVIVLLGAKITFAFQNVTAYEFMTEDVHLSHHFRHILCLRIAHFAVKRFVGEEPPPSAVEISNALAIPLPLVNRLAFHLLEAGVLVEVRKPKQQHTGYQPAKSVENLTIKSVLDMISHKGEEIPLPEGDEIQKILEYFDAQDALSSAPQNRLLKEI